MTTNLKTENALQAEAIRQCTCSDTIAFIERNGGIFRDVIESYKEKFERLPTVNELLWCSSEIARHDIRKEG